MKVRSNCTESANQSRLFRGDKINAFNALIHLSGNKRAHGTFALSAIKIATIVREHFAWATRTGIHRYFSGFVINAITYANDHETHMQRVRMIVKCGASDLQVQAAMVRFGALGRVLLDPGAPRAYASAFNLTGAC